MSNYTQKAQSLDDKEFLELLSPGSTGSKWP